MIQLLATDQLGTEKKKKLQIEIEEERKIVYLLRHLGVENFIYMCNYECSVTSRYKDLCRGFW